MKVPAFTDIGKEAKELLYGGRTSGIYQYDRKLSVNAKTSHAVDFALTSMARDGLLTMDTKATYKQGPLSIDVLPSRNTVTASVSQLVLEGLKVTLTGGLPDLQRTGKITLDYAHPYLTSKAACSLNASPKLDISAAAGYSGFVVGADASVDVTKSQLTKWTAAAAFVGPDFIVAGHLLDADTYKATYYQKVDASSSIGAEVLYNRVAADPYKIALGYSHTAINGDLHKLKISNDGTAHALYEFKPRPEITTAISLQINTIKEAEAPKMGIALEYNP